MPVAVGQKFRPLVAKKQAQTQQTQTQQTSNQRLSFKSSVAAMTSTIELTFGTIAYKRGLLDPDDLAARSLGMGPPSVGPSSSQASSSSLPLSQFSVTQSQVGSSQEVGGSQLMSVHKIKPSESPKAKYFISHIEGIKHALEAGYLNKASIFLLTDPNDRSNIVESYTLEFTYSDKNAAPSLVFSGARAGGKFTVPDTVNDLQAAVRAFAKSLLEVLDDLGELPGERWCDIQLEYNERAPPDYVAPGFGPDDQREVYFATHSAGEVPVQYKTETLQAFAHGYSVAVTSICPFLEDTGARNVRWNSKGVAEIAEEATEEDVPEDVFEATIEGVASIEGMRGERVGVWLFEMANDDAETQPEDTPPPQTAVLARSDNLADPPPAPAAAPPAPRKRAPTPKPPPKQPAAKRPKTMQPKPRPANTGGTFKVPPLPPPRPKPAPKPRAPTARRKPTAAKPKNPTAKNPPKNPPAAKRAKTAARQASTQSETTVENSLEPSSQASTQASQASQAAQAAPSSPSRPNTLAAAEILTGLGRGTSSLNIAEAQASSSPPSAPRSSRALALLDLSV